uniref:Uncharacterized protein n=1 Tax=Mycena chlorophos TaxID=658473 RepID=A0ABQ0LQ06_MYCCL|nr:predicted protein [Mycena chlorophos]
MAYTERTPRNLESQDCSAESIARAPPVVTPRLTSISYDAPKLVQSQLLVWRRTAQTTATVSALLAILAATIFGVFQSHRYPASATRERLHVLTAFSSYAAILFNILAMLSSIFFLDRLGSVEFNEACRGGERSTEGWISRPSSSLTLLVQFGASNRLRLIFYQWFAHLCFGVFFALLQIIAYLWLTESTAVGAIITAITVSAFAGIFLSALLDG